MLNLEFLRENNVKKHNYQECKHKRLKYNRHYIKIFRKEDNMANRDYQFETSPRKLTSDYETRRKNKDSAKTDKKKNDKKKNAKSNKKEKTNNIKAKQSSSRKEKAKQARKNKFLITINCIAILGVLFAIIMRNSLISQSFLQIQNLKSEISDLQKENDQLEISIQNNLNISDIEQQAKELLGMQKLTSRQTIYLNLPKKDYVEPSTEEVIIEEKQGIWENIVNFFENIF